MEKFTAIYLRVSTNKQAEHGTSLDYQHDSCWKMAKNLGVPDELIKVYREEGFSGEDIERPQMDELRDDVKNKLIKRIIILHPDRLSRNMVDRLIVCAEFDKHGVELLFVDVEYKDTEEGKLFFNIQSSIAQYELALIKKRTSRGIIKAVKDEGKIMGMRVSPFGYDYIKGEGKLEINKKEAEYVKKIFQWYVYDKLTMREIGERLYTLEVKPKRGENNYWSHSSIQNILKNETYIGKYYYNRRKTKKIKGQRTVNNNAKMTYEYRDKEEWIEIEVPKIVDIATFSLAQDQRVENTMHSGNIKHEYLLRKMIRCGHCGNKYSSYTTSKKVKNKNGEENKHLTRRYRCTNKNLRKFGEGIEPCPSKNINADQIEQYIWDNVVYPFVNNTDAILEELENNESKPNNNVTDMYNMLKSKIDKIEEEKKRIMSLFRKGYINENELDTDMEKLDKEQNTVKIELKKYENQITYFEKNKLNIENMKKASDEIKRKFNNGEEIPFDSKRNIIESLIDEIIVKFVGNKLTINCFGKIYNYIEEYQLSTQHQTIVDTTNTINIVFEHEISLEKGYRNSYEYKTISKNVSIM